jgi:hypothetical protein
MYAFRRTEVGAERQIVLDRLASGRTVDELMRVLVTMEPGASSTEALRRLSPEAGTEVLAALRGGGRSARPGMDPRPGLFAAFRPYRPAA